jgi:hypothetical protein
MQVQSARQFASLDVTASFYQTESHALSHLRARQAGMCHIHQRNLNEIGGVYLPVLTRGPTCASCTQCMFKNCSELR